MARTTWLRKLGKILCAIIRYPGVFVTLAICRFFFQKLNTTRVLWKKRARLRPGMAIISNHQSLMDSFAEGSSLFVPQILVEPLLLPWHMPDKSNFYSLWFLRPFMWVWKSIPVGRDKSGNRRDFRAFSRAIRELREGDVVHVFIEGTRSANGELGPPKQQVGAMVLSAGASVLPVYINGMHEVQPYRKKAGDPPRTWLRMFGRIGEKLEWGLHVRKDKLITIAVGEPIDESTIRSWAGEDGDLKERSRRVAERIMDEIRSLQNMVLSEHSA